MFFNPDIEFMDHIEAVRILAKFCVNDLDGVSMTLTTLPLSSLTSILNVTPTLDLGIS